MTVGISGLMHWGTVQLGPPTDVSVSTRNLFSKGSVHVGFAWVQRTWCNPGPVHMWGAAERCQGVGMASVHLELGGKK